MSDYSTSSVLSQANGQQNVSLQSLKMQFQAESQMAGVVAQSAQQAQSSGQQQEQASLKTSGPKGTQVNMVV